MVPFRNGSRRRWSHLWRNWESAMDWRSWRRLSPTRLVWFSYLQVWSKPGCLSIFSYKFDQKQVVCLFSFTMVIKTRLFSIFICNFDQNKVVCVFSFTKLIKTRLFVYFHLQLWSKPRLFVYLHLKFWSKPSLFVYFHLQFDQTRLFVYSHFV